jgi:membrane protease YdiL (CAAX protease family)
MIRPLFTLARVLLFCLCCAASLALFSPLTKDLPGIWPQILSVLLAAVCGLGLSLLFIRWEKLSLQDIGLMPGRRTLQHLLTGLLTGSVLVTFQFMAVFMGGHLKMVRSPEAGFTTISCNLLLYLFVACREEVAFRGYPLRSLDSTAGRLTAQLIVAAIFIAEHIVGRTTWAGAIVGAGMGAWLFGLAALRSKGIALPIGIHTAWNFGQWAWGLKSGSGIYKLVIEKGYEARAEQLGWLGFVIAMGSAIVIFHYKKDDASG